MELWRSSEARQRFWQRRSYDFNVFSERKMTEKLRYMHRNPVKRGLVSSFELWPWSSYRAYAFGERGPVNMDWMVPPYVVARTKVRRFGEPDGNEPNTRRGAPFENREGCGTHLYTESGKIKTMIPERVPHPPRLQRGSDYRMGRRRKQTEVTKNVRSSWRASGT